MVNRYIEINGKLDERGKRVMKPLLYPPIPRSVNDIYILTTPGDRLDLLAKKYYGDVGYYWMIAQANGIGKGSLTIPIGVQLRIPKEISTILQDYRDLNK
jgi:hypothetical protein